jgi:hypothetical protein
MKEREEITERDLLLAMGSDLLYLKQLNPKNMREEGKFLIGITGCR